ncbi:hypothetical protein DL98DRAFT_616638 [Cadophora sp. DSE1049]|nr:hypothetical protein DL98DRAFT_616638 [Cadophora sp. DSE1049]
MDEEDFAAWKTCWQVNLLFHKRVSSKPLKCIVCSSVNPDANGSMRSTFWVEATRCSAGHRQVTFSETQLPYTLGVCAGCDQNYMLDVVKGKHGCRREGCRRAVRVHEAEVHAKLWSDPELLQNFLFLFKRCRVYECAIHCDEVPYGPNSSVALKPPTPQCNHDRNVCNTCLKTTFEGAIRGGRLQDLVCLDTECKKALPLGSLRQYNKKLALALMSKDEKFRCIDAKKQIQKNHQKQAAIKAFKASAHKARENETATKREIARTTKKCPKAGCGNKIERNDGCGHFTCKKCSTEFCWCCKVIWKNKKVLHLAGCQIGSRSTTSKASLDKTGYAVGWDADLGYDVSLDKGLWLIEGHQ